MLQSLDTLGAGFQLASHDLDIRGAGNLLGEEQSGHIKDVGFELYQQMLEEAVAEVKGDEQVQDSGWSPQISVGTSVMIPEDYVPDLHLLVKLEADFLDMAGLFFAEQIARAENIEVVARQLETGAERVERLQHLQPPLRHRRQHLVDRQGEERKGTHL